MTPLESLGALVRNARLARQMSQHRASKAAGVSRRQWALLEQGGNVSVAFLLKVLRSLNLRIALDGQVTLAASGNADVFALVSMTEEFAELVERLRVFAMDAAMPPSMRGDAAVLGEFARDHLDLSEEEAARLDRTLGRAASDAVRRTPAAPKAEPARRRNARRRES